MKRITMDSESFGHLRFAALMFPGGRFEVDFLEFLEGVAEADFLIDQFRDEELHFLMNVQLVIFFVHDRPL